MNYRIIEGARKNSTLYLHNSYCYVLQHDLQNHLWVRCRNWRNKSCKATGKICKVTNTFTPSGFHLHPVSDSEIKILEMKTQCKRKAESANTTIREVFDEVSTSVDVETAASVSFNQVESTMLKRRRRIEPPLPTSALDSVRIIREEPHLCDSYITSVVSDAGCSMLFCGVEQRRLQPGIGGLVASVDGTFKVTPRHFKQVLCIHLLRHDDGRSHAFPLIICCMTNKTEELYRQVFAQVRNTLPWFQPESIMMDFERGLRNAARETFLHISLKGCWFHYKRALVKKIKKLFSLHQRRDKQLKSWFLSLMAIPLLPPTKITEAFNCLLEYDFQDIDTSPFKRYIRRQWRDGIPAAELSVYRLNDRTNNSAEAFNRQFNKGGNQSNFYDFLRRVSRTFTKYHLEFQRLQNGLTITRRETAVDRSNRTRVERAWDLFDQESNLTSFFNVVKYINEHALQENDGRDGSSSESDENDIDAHDVNPGNAAGHAEVVQEIRPVCRVCLELIEDNSPRWVLIPCGHAPFCNVCIEIIVGDAARRVTRSRYNKCPVCREDIQNTLRIFL